MTRNEGKCRYSRKSDSVANLKPSRGTWVAIQRLFSRKGKRCLCFSDVDQYPKSTPLKSDKRRAKRCEGTKLSDDEKKKKKNRKNRKKKSGDRRGVFPETQYICNPKAEHTWHFSSSKAIEIPIRSFLFFFLLFFFFLFSFFVLLFHISLFDSSSLVSVPFPSLRVISLSSRSSSRKEDDSHVASTIGEKRKSSFVNQALFNATDLYVHVHAHRICVHKVARRMHRQRSNT